MIIAQILNSKVHWIFETSETMGELRGRFAPDIVFAEVADDVEEGWEWDGEKAVKSAEPERTLEELKVEAWERIKAERDRREQSGVPYMGKVLDSDPISVQRIAIAVQAAQAYPALTIDWTCADNTVLTMTAEQVCGIPVALAQHSDGLHQTARGLRVQIFGDETTPGSATKEELGLIVWPE